MANEFTVGILDDSDSGLGIMEELVDAVLRNLGHDKSAVALRPSSDRREADIIAASGDCDLLLVDLMWPDGDGAESRSGLDIAQTGKNANQSSVVVVITSKQNQAEDFRTDAKARGADWVIIDTAGRLHTKSGLMRELEKVQRVCKRATDRDPEEVLLVLDATTGQNALRQAEVFGEVVALTGVVVAKLDGTAKGGIVLGIKKRFGIPIRYIGTGETIDDLAPFNPEEFAHALFE